VQGDAGGHEKNDQKKWRAGDEEWHKKLTPKKGM
jgi:hypothetical protein